jgi:hypothetical protein
VDDVALSRGCLHNKESYSNVKGEQVKQGEQTLLYKDNAEEWLKRSVILSLYLALILCPV